MAGCGVNHTTHNNITLLMTATEFGRQDIVKILINYGANIEAKSSNGWTALMYAARDGYTLLIDLLYMSKKKNIINEQDNFGITALMLAAREGHIETVNILLQLGANSTMENNVGKIALFDAIEYGDFLIVRDLINIIPKEKLNHQSLNGNTALMYASYTGEADIVGLLLRMGANPNLKNAKGDTPLSNAAKLGYDSCVLILIEFKADLYSYNNLGITPFHIAAKSGNSKTVQHFLNKGINPNHTSIDNNTALIFASSLGQDDVVNVLLNTKLYQCKSNNNIDIDIDIQNNFGSTALIAAADKGYSNIVTNLLEHGANPSIENYSGNSALLSSVKSGYYDTIIKIIPYLPKESHNQNLTWLRLLSQSENNTEELDIVNIIKKNFCSLKKY